jgi:two-component system, NarL family, invasion response regulator UvrY
LRLARKKHCDVFLLDISMPSRNGIDTLKQLRKEFPRLPVLMLSMHSEEQYAVRAIKSGAAGYLTKQSAPELLVTAIRQVAGGKRFISPTLADQLAAAISDDHEKMPHERVRIASGKPLKLIAQELNLSVKTVSEYRKRLLDKMRLMTTADIIRYGVEHGLVQ